MTTAIELFEGLTEDQAREVLQQVKNWLGPEEFAGLMTPALMHAATRRKGDGPALRVELKALAEQLRTVRTNFLEPHGVKAREARGTGQKSTADSTRLSHYLRGEAGDTAWITSLAFLLWLDREIRRGASSRLTNNKRLTGLLHHFNGPAILRSKIARVMGDTSIPDYEMLATEQAFLLHLQTLLQIDPGVSDEFAAHFLHPDQQLNRHFLVYRRSEAEEILVKGFLVVEPARRDPEEGTQQSAPAHRPVTFSHFHDDRHMRQARGIVMTTNRLYYFIGANGPHIQGRPAFDAGIKCIVTGAEYTKGDSRIFSGLFLSQGNRGAEPIAGRCVIVPCKPEFTAHTQVGRLALPISELAADLEAFADDALSEDKARLAKVVKAIETAIDNGLEVDNRNFLAGPLLIAPPVDPDRHGVRD